MSEIGATTIHPLAVVEDGAVVGTGCRIGPFCHLVAGAVLGSNCVLDTGVIVHRGGVLGEGVRVYSHAVVGGDPQYIGWDCEIRSGVSVGDRTVLREGVTIHRSIYPGMFTKVGRDCYLMASAHVGHDCVVADRVVVANACQLGGHVEVGARSFLGGAALFHQFVRIGQGVMVGGGSIITKDIAPFLLVADRNRIAGLNQVGLRRAGVSAESVEDLKACYREVLQVPGTPMVAATNLMRLPDYGWTEEGRLFLEFLMQTSKRGIAKG